MKTLVLAEKPSVGKDIARVLGCKKGANGYIEGEKYVVTWALGHLVTLADPEHYNQRYKTWNIDDLPILPERLDLVVIRESSKQYKTVKELLFRKDIQNIVIATDAGREGELVARWILEKAGCKKNSKRLWISSVTDKAIGDGFRQLKDGRAYLNLCDSAKARAEADWLVGINATRCLTTKFNSQLSCGRVQTPTVAIINNREEEIKNFQPQKYYELFAEANPYRLSWHANRCFDQEKINQVYNNLKNTTQGIVKEVSKKNQKQYSPRLYDLTELQRDANKRFSFSPKETLSIMQKLYEHHKVLTYPRTDSRFISSDIVPTIPDRLKACKAPKELLQQPIKAGSHFVDNSKVSDHHAIIPTEEPVLMSELSDKERKIYNLVVTRFISVLMPPFEYEQTTLQVEIGQELFTAKGKVVLNKGYTSVEKEEEDDQSQSLPSLKKGDIVKINRLTVTEGRTKPPALYNEATLLSAMENPVGYSDASLGTVATRADIIEKLFDSFLIEKKGNDIFTTSKGRQLLKLAPDGLRSPALTGQWEKKLLQISEGKLKKDIFLQEIRKYTQQIILDIKKSQEVFRHDNLSTTKCPTCGKLMLAVNGKKGKMLVCQDRECNYRESLSITTRARCAQCHRFLEIVGSGEKRRVVCSCGHNEKYESFEKRKKAESNQLSKKDVQQYIRKINDASKQSAESNPFAALKDFKFD